MAIEYVGGVSSSRNGNTNATTTQSLTGLTGGIASAPAENDLVIVCCVVGSQTRNTAQAISGYSTLGTQLNPNTVTYDTSLQVSYKKMTATPDTSITIPAQGNAADGQAWAVMVFRGVDTTTPFDPASVSATGTGTGRFDAPAITPANAGSWIVIAGGGAAAAGAAYTAPTDFATDWISPAAGADTNDAMAAMGYYTGWTSGSYDPAAVTGGTTGANDSWAAWTMALKPGASPVTLDVTHASVTPSAQAVAGERPINAGPAQLTPSTQTIDLILGAVLVVAAASCTPTTQAIALNATASVAVDHRAITPATQPVAVGPGIFATRTAITPATQTVAVGPGTTVTHAANTPATQPVVLANGCPVTRAAVTPATQDLTLTATAGATLAVDAASQTPSTKAITFALTVPVTRAAITPATQDVTLTATSGYTLAVTTASITPSTGVVGAEHTVAALPAQVTPATEEIGLSLAVSYTLAVTQAAITPAPQAISLLPSGSFVLPVTRAAITPAGQVLAGERAVYALPAQIIPAPQQVTLSTVAQAYTLPVTAASLTPATYDVDGLIDREFDQAQIIPALQDIVLDAQRRVAVTAATVSPVTQAATLRFTMPAATRAMTPGVQNVALGLSRAILPAQVTPSPKDIGSLRSESPIVTVEAAALTPATQQIVLANGAPLVHASVTPATQTTVILVRGPVTAASIAPESVGIALRVATTLEPVAVQPVTQNVAMFDQSSALLQVSPLYVTPSGKAINLIYQPTTTPDRKRVLFVDEPGRTIAGDTERVIYSNRKRVIQ